MTLSSYILGLIQQRRSERHAFSGLEEVGCGENEPLKGMKSLLISLQNLFGAAKCIAVISLQESERERDRETVCVRVRVSVFEGRKIKDGYPPQPHPLSFSQSTWFSRAYFATSFKQATTFPLSLSNITLLTANI